jgi:hypothetical protein
MRPPQFPAAIALVLLLSLAFSPPAWGQLGTPEAVDGAPIRTVLPVDAIPAIDEPQYAPAEEAAAFMKPDEPVMGVAGGGEAKAFSLWQLHVHEIVNDVIGGTPVAVTW